MDDSRDAVKTSFGVVYLVCIAASNRPIVSSMTCVAFGRSRLLDSYSCASMPEYMLCKCVFEPSKAHSFLFHCVVMRLFQRHGTAFTAGDPSISRHRRPPSSSRVGCTLGLEIFLVVREVENIRASSDSPRNLCRLGSSFGQSYLASRIWGT
jgi:hypothetical protein